MLVNIVNAQVEMGAEVHVVIINNLYEDRFFHKLVRKRQLVVHFIYMHCKFLLLFGE